MLVDKRCNTWKTSTEKALRLHLQRIFTYRRSSGAVLRKACNELREFEDTLKDWSVVDPSILTEFRKEAAFSIRSTPKSEVWNYPSATTVVAPAISVECVDQGKREFNNALDRRETSKNVSI
ncbi:hypothetical protein TSMEX_005187 [Taenia solium]|eukprot:TsM_000943100 transcript=TsM_000943100 gene=TsM_000943100